MKKNIIVLTSLILLLGILFSYGTSFSVFAEETKPTAQLLEEALNHPDIWQIPLFDSPELFLSLLQSRCPSLSSFLERTDCIQAIANRYNIFMNQNEEYSFIQKCQMDILCGLENMITSSNGGSRFTSVDIEDTVYTCKGNPVAAYRRTYCKYDDEDLAAIRGFSGTYESTIELYMYTPYYNCHSYAWYSQDIDNPYWIDFPGAFLTDGTYIQTNWGVGDIIVYRSNNAIIHSGRIVAKTGNSLSQITVVSKWGWGPLFQHRGDDCMYAEVDNCTVTVYRLCVHDEATHEHNSVSSYFHAVVCPVCGELEREPHVLNTLNRCTICGGKGSSIVINSCEEVYIQ